EGARCGRRDAMQLLFMRQRTARASARARSSAARRVSSPAPRAVRLSLIEWPVTCGQSYAKASDNDGTDKATTRTTRQIVAQSDSSAENRLGAHGSRPARR